MEHGAADAKVTVEFLGVGEACDETQPNTSLLLWIRPVGDPSTSMQILLDCGFSVPHRYFQACSDPEVLDAVWISHFHGDHFFGIPLLLLRFWEMKRLKPLTIVTQPGGRERVLAAMDLAYPGFAKKLTFPLHELALDAGHTVSVHGTTWRAAQTEHGQKNLSVRIDGGQWSLFYSGDGCPTPETQTLAEGCTLAVHEAFMLNGHWVAGHGSVHGCLAWARAAGVRRLVLVHMQRDVRRTQWREILDTIHRCHDMEVLVPASGDTVLL